MLSWPTTYIFCLSKSSTLSCAYIVLFCMLASCWKCWCCYCCTQRSLSWICVSVYIAYSIFSVPETFFTSELIRQCQSKYLLTCHVNVSSIHRLIIMDVCTWCSAIILARHEQPKSRTTYRLMIGSKSPIRSMFKLKRETVLLPLTDGWKQFLLDT